MIERVLTRLRQAVYQTEFEKEFARWCADGGDEALRFNYDLGPDALVLDFGGYKGQWASDVFGRFACRVFVFEPVLSFARNIEQRFHRNPKIRVFPIALGGARRQEVISLGADGTSMFRQGAATETIQVEDVAEFFAKYGIAQVDLVKVNVEGGEYELLPRMIEAGLMEKVRHLQVQFHDLAPDSAERMERIRQSLLKTHELVYQYRFVWESWRRRDTKVE